MKAMKALDHYKRILQSPSVRHLTKLILMEAWKKDAVDAVNDVELALSVLKLREQELLDK